EVVEAFMLDRPDPALDVPLSSGARKGMRCEAAAGLGQRLVEAQAELRVVVADDKSGRIEAVIMRALDEVHCLIRGPRLVRLRRRGRSDHSPRLDVQE